MIINARCTFVEADRAKFNVAPGEAPPRVVLWKDELTILDWPKEKPGIFGRFRAAVGMKNEETATPLKPYVGAAYVVSIKRPQARDEFGHWSPGGETELASVDAQCVRWRDDGARATFVLVMDGIYKDLQPGVVYTLEIEEAA